MAYKKKKVVVKKTTEAPIEIKTVKKQIPTKTYTIKNRVKVQGIWFEKDDIIKLTKEGFAFFRSKKYI